jgi:hypothetical protein
MHIRDLIPGTRSYGRTGLKRWSQWLACNHRFSIA